jgi:hypothetical protein
MVPVWFESRTDFNQLSPVGATALSGQPTQVQEAQLRGQAESLFAGAEASTVGASAVLPALAVALMLPAAISSFKIL